MLSDKIKQKARLSILERLKQQMPGGALSPVPSPLEEIPEMSEEEQETLNDMGLETNPLTSKKKRPVRL